MVKIKIWKPLDTISGKYWLESLALIDEKFVFIYRKHQQKNIQVHVICGGGLPSFRYTNETYLEGFTYFDDPEEMEKIRPWCFYTVEDSEYLKKISDESGELSDILGFNHYCIISENETIDLVYPAEPIVEIVVNGKIIESSDEHHRSIE